MLISLKRNAGLTLGNGMTEERRALWIISTPITYQYNDIMQEFRGLTYTTSQCHRETTLSRMKQNYCDIEKVKERLLSCMPFSPNLSLRLLLRV